MPHIEANVLLQLRLLQSIFIFLPVGFLSFSLGLSLDSTFSWFLPDMNIISPAALSETLVTFLMFRYL